LCKTSIYSKKTTTRNLRFFSVMIRGKIYFEIG
jgi:hypothetical protein